MSGCAMLNLSLLMSDIWAVAIRSLVFHQKVSEPLSLAPLLLKATQDTPDKRRVTSLNGT